MRASVGPSPNLRNRAKACFCEAMLAWISASLRSWRVSSLPDGSPTLVVPPPTMTIGLWPVCCSRRSIMMVIRLPTCSDGAVAS